MKNRITIQDIANTANVSKSTVSRVLNDNTPVNAEKKKAVLDAIEKLNYKPNVFARGLAGGRSMTLGVVTQNIGSPFYDSVTQGIVKALAGSNYSPIFVDGQWDPKIELDAIRTLIDRSVDGLILLGGNLDPESLLAECEELPMIAIARMIPGAEQACISIDNTVAAYKATKLLIESGHKRIVHLQGIEEHADAIDRLQGYKNAIKEAGLELDPDLIVQGNFSSQSGVIAVESLILRNISFSAIFSANDEMAFGARLALYRRGIRVPEEVSLVGFDNQPNSAFMTPPLTTVAQPAMEMGMAAANAVLDMLKGKPFTLPQLSTEVVVRESVKKLF
jgi:LacI family transcriptional regulator